MDFFNELKRRKVFRVTSFYAVTAWGASMGAAELLPAFGLPDDSVRWFVIAALGLLPIVALLAWLYELTPGGIERDPADREDISTRVAPEHTEDEMMVMWRGNRWTFRNTFTIGRDEACELHISDSKISRRHVRIIAQHGTWYVEDLSSSNGTTVNGELVTHAALPRTSLITLYEGGEEIKLNIKALGDTRAIQADSNG